MASELIRTIFNRVHPLVKRRHWFMVLFAKAIFFFSQNEGQFCYSEVSHHHERWKTIKLTSHRSHELLFGRLHQQISSICRHQLQLVSEKRGIFKIKILESIFSNLFSLWRSINTSSLLLLKHHFYLFDSKDVNKSEIVAFLFSIFERALTKNCRVESIEPFHKQALLCELSKYTMTICSDLSVKLAVKKYSQVLCWGK